MIQRGNCKGTHFSRNLNQETSKKDVMTKLDGLDAEQQEKTQSIDEEKDLELDEFEK